MNPAPFAACEWHRAVPEGICQKDIPADGKTVAKTRVYLIE
jgi:hypothetical protein